MFMPFYMTPLTTLVNMQFVNGIVYKIIYIKAKLINENILLIGDDYIFTDVDLEKNAFNLSSKLKKVDCQISIHNASQNSDFLKTNNYGIDKSGLLLFYKETTNNNGEIISNPCIVFELHIDEHFFHSIYENIQHRLPINTVKVDVENISYAHPNNNNLKIWDYESTQTE